jgi:hypothetical protein
MKLFTHASSLEYTKTNLHRGQHLIQLLQSFRELQVTDKKDKLFAFWGLACGELPAPDYEGSTTSVYTSIAKWILEDTQDLLLLAMGLPADPELPGLPSWVPSLSVSPFETNYYRRRLRCLDAYDCAKGIDVSIHFEDPETLCLQGTLLDEVVDVARQMFASDLDAALHTALLRDWQEFASDCPVDGRRSDDLFCETLIAGCSHKSSGGSLSFPVATAADISLCRQMILQLTSGCSSEDDDSNKLTATRQAHRGACLDRILFRTKSGRLGLGSPSLKKGDEVWTLGGGRAPFILRHALQGREYPTYSLVGHAYVSGIMHGEAFNPETPPQPCRLV